MDKLQNFVIWLDGYFDAVGDEINISKTNVIRNKLNTIFEHEADILVEKPTLQELGEKHDFEVYDGLPPSNDDNNSWSPMGGDGQLYRC